MFAFRKKIPIEAYGFFKQQGVGSTIQSNDIEHLSHLFSRNKCAISLQKEYEYLFHEIFVHFRAHIYKQRQKLAED